eukprot:768561-Hanusia_phi.AAC.4
MVDASLQDRRPPLLVQLLLPPQQPRDRVQGQVGVELENIEEPGDDELFGRLAGVDLEGAEGPEHLEGADSRREHLLGQAELDEALVDQVEVLLQRHEEPRVDRDGAAVCLATLAQQLRYHADDQLIEDVDEDFAVVGLQQEQPQLLAVVGDGRHDRFACSVLPAVPPGREEPVDRRVDVLEDDPRQRLGADACDGGEAVGDGLQLDVLEEVGRHLVLELLLQLHAALDALGRVVHLRADVVQRHAPPLLGDHLDQGGAVVFQDVGHSHGKVVHGLLQSQRICHLELLVDHLKEVDRGNGVELAVGHGLGRHLEIVLQDTIRPSPHHALGLVVVALVESEVHTTREKQGGETDRQTDRQTERCEKPERNRHKEQADQDRREGAERKRKRKRN